MTLGRNPRKDSRVLSVEAYQQKRRDEALARQQTARRSRTDLARQLALQTETLLGPGEPEQQEVAMQESQPSEPVPREPRQESVRRYYAGQFMQPEWLIDVPPDLVKSWWGPPLPRSVMHVCFGGAADTATPTSTDLLCWKGYVLADCGAQFRQFWVQSKLAEVEGLTQRSEQHRYPFVPVPAYRCDPAGLRTAHSGPVPFERDGCLLLHGEGHYEAGPTPLALLWKDAACSRYPIDTDASGTVQPYQMVTLEFRMDLTVATGDAVPAALGKLPAEAAQHMGKHLRPGKLLRFSIREGGLAVADGRVVGADLRFEGPASQRRGRADPLSKVIFQHQARQHALSMQDLVAAAECQAGGQPAREGMQQDAS